MRTKNNFRKRKFLALCLSALMIGSAVAGFAACSDDDTSSSDNKVTESTKKTVGLIQNANFATDKFNDTTPIITSSTTGWSRSLNSSSSGSARSSQSASGIIDTESNAWANLTASKVSGADKLSDADAESKWKEMSVYDKLAFYKDWDKREENDDKKLSELSFYQSFNIDFDDIPTVANPTTHPNAEDTKVLMIHNEYSSSTSSIPSYQKAGTAQKYTSSSSVKVAAGTSAQFSVWVKTSDLQTSWTNGEPQKAVDRGAYISITHSVGGQSMDPLLVKNINTEGVTENNGWVQYEFLLNGSSYADTTFTIVLGLGLGGGTDHHEYVNGYAFFDDVQCKTITNAKYNELKTAANANYVDVVTEDTNEFKAAEKGTKYALAFHKDFTATPEFLTDWKSGTGAKVGAPTTEKKNDKIYTAANGEANTEVYKGLGFNTADDKAEIYDNVAAMNNSGNAYLQKVYDEYFVSESEFFTASIKNNPLLMLLSSEGAAYTATYFEKITVPAPQNNQKGNYLALTFFLKTSDMNGVTGAGVTVKDADTKHTLSNLDTSSTAGVDIDDDNKDIYDGWQQCFIFLANETDKDKTFELSFTLGSTTVVDTTKANYERGFAAFAAFQTVEIEDKKEFERAVSGTYSLLVNLEGAQEEETGDNGFDSAVSVPFDALEKGYANAQNYKGVTKDSVYLAAGNNDKVNTSETAGLLSKDYITLEDENGSKSENVEYTKILDKLIAANGGTYTATGSNEDKWNSIFGNIKNNASDNSGSAVQQPLVIYNEAMSAYGFIGNSKTLAADTYATVSLRVKTSIGAKASVYLVNTDSEKFEVLSSSRTLTYWYDKDGNVCSKDPSANDFHTKKDVAFKKINANGLYQANPAWRNFNQLSAENKTAYFANLSAYTQKDDQGNLLTAKGAVTYNYNDNWQNEGNDGIAFYNGTNGYYADKDCKVLVKDLASVTKANETDDSKPLAARYTAKEATANEQYAFQFTTNGEWATVTFYLHAGSKPINYRLEVWSGSRDGVTSNNANTYVMFDSNNPGEVTADNFTTLLDERKESLTAEEDYFENAFSFFDTADFLRYNPNLDENGIGDSYEDYDPTAHTSGVAFLRYDSNTEKEIFADLSYENTAVAADVEDDTEDTEEEEETESETNVWLLAGSITIAGALLLAVVSLIVRKAVAKARRKRGYKVTTAKKESVKKAKKD